MKREKRKKGGGGPDMLCLGVCPYSLSCVLLPLLLLFSSFCFPCISKERKGNTRKIDQIEPINVFLSERSTRYYTLKARVDVTRR